ncbi:RecT-like ssDNA annealing protein [Mycobacterium phage Pinnie]|uniref:RecT-like ssDNA binding protein n=1 Tax=Mycobacterium phage Pinnie TaxID=2517965 RepID=A0A482J8I9_9CAUD|nr:RecT-like ssDNA annealing protein [Mycobacterium phage Pinnie]QBP30257.1 RecT-like ssDNA binding protein [Mycobacterium phage Pinnie]
MTSNEVAQQDPRDAGTLEVFPPARPRQSTAVAVLMEHAETYNTAWKLAGQLVRTSLVPKRFAGKQADAAAAILYGAELGLKPWQAVQRVVPIHGMPTLESRTMVGLLKAAGYKVRTTEQSDTSVTVVGRDQDGDEYVSTWTIDRAIRAGYVPTPKPGVENPNPLNDDDWVSVEKFWDGKRKVSVLGNMKYITDPQTMLKAKAQAEVCREMAPDVLMGIGYSREDLESETFDDEPEPQRPPSNVVTEDEIFAEEVPLDRPVSTEDPTNPTDNPRPAAEQPTSAQETPAAPPAPDTTETPAGDAETDAQPVDPSPAEHDAEADLAAREADAAQAAPIVEGPTAEQIAEQAKRAKIDADAAEKSKRIAAKRSTAPAADPDRPKSRMRKALEKRLYGLLGDAGYGDDANRDGKIALYQGILGRSDVTSTDDLDDTAIGKVADQLYAWQQQNALVDEADATVARVVAGETSPATAADPTSEGNE